MRLRNIILHHGLGHHPLIRTLAARLGLPQEIVIHDYASFCPRVNLLTRTTPDAPLRYCGEPAVPHCTLCVERNGDETFEGLTVPQRLARSAAEFAAAARITTPSADATRRIARHFPGIHPSITPWEADTAREPSRPTARQQSRTTSRRIAVIGGIGPAKGYDILLDCAHDAAARQLPLHFIIAGASADDEPLMQAGIFITGAYEEGQATALLASLDADLAFLPSIWPETWCFALGEAWAAGLQVLAFDLGAQADRIRATGRGAVLPLGLPAARINDTLLAWQPDSGHSTAPEPRPERSNFNQR